VIAKRFPLRLKPNDATKNDPRKHAGVAGDRSKKITSLLFPHLGRKLSVVNTRLLSAVEQFNCYGRL
jgi:hypothetical protein